MKRLPPQPEGFCVDLHVHSKHSRDGKGSILELAHAAKAVGLQGFAVTDHDTVAGHRFIEEAVEATGLLIIPSIEVTTAEGHILALGVEELIEPRLGIPETTQSIRDQGGIAIAAHPLRLLSGAGPSNLRRRAGEGHLDGVEGFNGRERRIVQHNTTRLADRLTLPTTGGSDAHAPRDLGVSWTQFDRSLDSVQDLLAAIREGRCVGAGGNLKRRRVWSHAVATGWGKVRGKG